MGRNKTVLNMQPRSQGSLLPFLRSEGEIRANVQPRPQGLVKREDPGDEVRERLTWPGQAREFILIKTLSALPWGHWRQISYQSAPPSNRLFVITNILEYT